MSKNDDDTNDFKSKKQSETYKVGYKHPPLHSKFKKGVSGNSAGRPKKLVTVDQLFLKHWNKLTLIKQNGKLCKISNAELSCMQFIKSAATSGKPQTLKLLFELAAKAEAAHKKLNDDTDIDNFDWTEAQEKMFQELEAACDEIKKEESKKDD